MMFTWRSSLRGRKTDAAARNRTLVHLVREYQDHLGGRLAAEYVIIEEAGSR
jgi:hypothetical protein